MENISILSVSKCARLEEKAAREIFTAHFVIFLCYSVSVITYRFAVYSSCFIVHRQHYAACDREMVSRFL